MKKEKLAVIIGPTAVGKTKLSIYLAKKFGGEIISGDSMQVYRGMDIGTAKIKEEETEGIQHHLIDILEPDADFSVSLFQEKATQIIQKLNQNMILPILVGGTGLYVQAVTHQFQFAEVTQNEQIRQHWQAYLEQNGAEALHQQLLQRDPEYARQLHPNNARRVIRALEIFDRTGKSMSDYQGEWHQSSPYDLFMIGLTMERSRLYERINQRVDQMLEEGLLEEVQRLLDQGLSPAATSMQAIGYKEMVQYLQGELSKEEAIQLLKRNTRRYAKRQLTWFRRMKEVTWFDVTDLGRWSQYEKIISEMMAGKFK